MNDLTPLKEAIFEVGLLFSKASQPSEAQINAYARALQKYTPAQITHAFNQVVLSGSAFFPSLAEVLAHLKPKGVSTDDIGNFVANEVIQKVIDFGIYRLNDAFNELSDVSKRTIGENTYLLREIANSDQDSLPTIRAQIRGLAKAATESHKSEKHNEKLNKIGISTDNVLTMKKVEMKTMDFSGYLPEGA